MIEPLKSKKALKFTKEDIVTLFCFLRRRVNNLVPSVLGNVHTRSA